MIKCEKLLTKIVGAGGLGSSTTSSYSSGFGGGYCSETSEMAKLHDFEMNGNMKFSEEGCLMTATAKIISELSGKEVYLREVNDKFDKNSGGLLSSTEIKDGMNDYLDAVFGDIYDIKTNSFEKELSNEKFIEVSQLEDTYILARVYGDFDSNGKNEHHWIVLEGYTTDKNGRLIFNYDGTSNNDVGRVYVYGKADNSKKEFLIDKIETFQMIKK